MGMNAPSGQFGSVVDNEGDTGKMIAMAPRKIESDSAAVAVGLVKSDVAPLMDQAQAKVGCLGVVQLPTRPFEEYKVRPYKPCNGR